MNLPNLKAKFFSDPDWAEMEELIRGYIDPLKDMSTIDTTQPAEAIKAEVIARKIAYEGLDTFLNESGVLSQRVSFGTPTKFK